MHENRVRIGYRIITSTLPAFATREKLDNVVDYILVELTCEHPWREATVDALALLGQRFEITIHSFDALCREGVFNERRLDAIAHAIDLSGAGWISEHACFTVPTDMGDGMIALPFPLAPDVLDVVCENAKILSSRVNVPVLIEELGRPMLWPWDVIDDVSATWRLIEKTQCGLVLDLSQAATTAARRGESLESYVRSLPLQQIREIHVEPPDVNREFWNDDLNLLAAILPATSTQAITVESFERGIPESSFHEIRALANALNDH